MALTIVPAAAQVAPAQCSNGTDDDGDGETDFPADPGCASATDNSESPDALTGETLISFPPAQASGTCNRVGNSTYSFSVSGTATGPYPGTFTEVGTVTIGPQTEEFIPGQFRGPVTAFEAAFTITSTAGVVRGNKTLVANQPSPNNIGVCADGGIGAQVIATRLTYEATISTAQGLFSDVGTSAVRMNLCTLPAPCGDIPAQANFRETFVSTGLAPIIPEVQCSNDIDDDSDGRTDFPSDTGCESATDDSESPDPPPPEGVSIGDIEVVEGDRGAIPARFTLTLTRPQASVVEVAFATEDGLATAAGGDYKSRTGTVTIPVGATTAFVEVPVRGDILDEGNESFVVRLTSVAGADAVDVVGAGVIRDDDPPVVTRANLSIGDVAITEADAGITIARLTITLSEPRLATVTVRATVDDGTAIAPGDHEARSVIVTIPAGASGTSFKVRVSGDEAVEPDEVLSVRLSDSSGPALGDAVGTVTIRTDD